MSCSAFCRLNFLSIIGSLFGATLARSKEFIAVVIRSSNEMALPIHSVITVFRNNVTRLFPLLMDGLNYNFTDFLLRGHSQGIR